MQITVFVKRGLAVILCLVFLSMPQMQVSATGIGNGYILAEKNDRLELYYSSDKAHILVRDRQNGYIWDSVLPEEQIPDDATDVQRQEMESLFSITYTCSRNDAGINCKLEFTNFFDRAGNYGCTVS